MVPKASKAIHLKLMDYIICLMLENFSVPTANGTKDDQS